MSVTPEETQAMAALARLRLDSAEARRMAADLSNILNHMDVLGSAETAGVPPFCIAAQDVAPPRPDEPGTDAMHVAPADNAPSWRDGFFTVPRLEAQRKPLGRQGGSATGDS